MGGDEAVERSGGWQRAGSLGRRSLAHPSAPNRHFAGANPGNHRWFLLVRGAGLLAGGAKGTAAFEHVHGIGFNPADNTVYAATHDGLFRLPTAGPPVRVADRVQDFMGFTVVGPDHFLASGHPGEGSSGPSSLGLIESTDRGNTWTSLSLAGKADFHALQARHGTIYGYNSMTGAFLVSANGLNNSTGVITVGLHHTTHLHKGDLPWFRI